MRKTVIIILTLLVVLLAFSGCAGGKKAVTLDVQNAKIAIEAPAKATVEKILAEAQITLGEKDTVDPALTAVPEDGAVIRISRYAKATIVTADGEKKSVELTGATVKDALREAGITLADNEEVNADQNAFLSDLTGDIVISRFYIVTVTADGKTAEYKSKRQTVKEFLDAEKIAVSESDSVTPALTETIGGDTQIVIARSGEKTETVTETIEYQTRKEYSDSLDEGETRTKQSGANGEKSVTYRITLLDGKEVGREKISEKIVKEAVDEIIVYGTNKPAPAETERTIVSKVNVPDCDGSGHGYYVITYSDGTEEYEEY